MNNVNFTRSNLKDVIFNNDDHDNNLRNVNFQECTNMENMNFKGLDLQGAKLVGVILTNCNFKEANLRGCQFDVTDITGVDFTNADLLNSNVGIAIGADRNNTIEEKYLKARAVDTHKFFNNIDINKLLDFYKNHIQSPQTNYSDDNILRSNVSGYLKLMIDRLDENSNKKNTLTDGLNKCFSERLDSFIFSQNIPGTDPIVNFRTLIFWAIHYVVKQPKVFRDNYVMSLIKDSVETYEGPNGLSCAAGIVERIITIMEQAASAAMSINILDKVDEYNELISIILNDPNNVIKTYQLEWFKYHKENGEHEFNDEWFRQNGVKNNEDDKIDAIMKNYKEYLEEMFKFNTLRGEKKEKIQKIIMNHPTAGVEITKQLLKGKQLNFGGKKILK